MIFILPFFVIYLHILKPDYVSHRKIVDFNQFLSLEREWNTLEQKNPNVFLRHEWFKSWWMAYGNHKKLWILLVKENNELIGIAPLMLSKTLFRFFPVRRIEFIKNDESPRCDFLYKDREKTIKKIIDYLISYNKWDLVTLEGIPEDSKTPELLKRYCSERKLDILIKPSLNSPFLNINTDWKTFYKSKTQRFKKRLRYNKNKIKKLGQITIDHITSNNIEKALSEVFYIGHKSWKEQTKKSISSTNENKKFFFYLTNEAALKEWLSLWILRIEGKPVAFEYHLKYKNIVHALRAEFDEHYEKYSPGSVLDAYIVEQLFSKNIKGYDMGGSADAYKTHWTSCLKLHVNVFIFNKKLYSKFIKSIESKMIPFLKKNRIVKTIRNYISRQG